MNEVMGVPADQSSSDDSAFDNSAYKFLFTRDDVRRAVMGRATKLLIEQRHLPVLAAALQIEEAPRAE